MGPSSFVQSHRPSRSTSHSVSYSDDSLYPSLVSILSSSHSFKPLSPSPSSSPTHQLNPSSPSYILPGCQHLVLECLHLPRGLCMARGRYVLSPTLPPFTFHPLPAPPLLLFLLLTSPYPPPIPPPYNLQLPLSYVLSALQFISL